MNLHNCRLTLLVFLIYSLCACSEDKIGGEALEGSCGITLKLATDHVVDLPLTKAGNEVTNQDLQVRIENTRAEVLKEWNYSDLPQLIRVNPGSYKMVAWHGTDSLYPLFDTPYYYGEIKLKMKDGDNIDTTMTCVSKAVQISVNFDESFDFDYSEYSVDIKTDGDSLNFAQNETRTGYFKPGKLRLRFVLKPKGQEQYYEFYPPAVATAKEREWYKMTLKANSNNGALESITITTDTTTIDIPVMEELSPIFLPKKAPKILTQGFTSGDNITVPEGSLRQTITTIQASGGLKSLILRTTSDTLIAHGWPKEIDLTTSTLEEQQLLRKLGLKWSDAIITEEATKKMVFIDFGQVISGMNAPVGSATLANFELLAADKYQQLSNLCTFNVHVSPIFKFKGDVPDVNGIWATKMFLELEYDAARTTHTPTFQYASLDGEWHDVTNYELTSWGAQAIITGLDPNTQYKVRGKIAELLTNESIISTEAATQIPNSGFEDFYSEKVWEKASFGGKAIYAFYPYLENSVDTWWNTVNRTTTQGFADFSWYYAAFPGTVPTDQGSWTASWHWNKYGGQKIATDAFAGNRSIEIATIGWGKNNWPGGTPGTQYRTAGQLYIGNYDITTHQEQYGHSFTSRPTAVNFAYRFFSYDGETTKATVQLYDIDNELIGSGEFIVSAATNTFEQVTMPITYSTMKRCASKISIIFKSTDSESPKTKAIKGGNGAFSGFGDSRHIGSILTVDNVELIY